MLNNFFAYFLMSILFITNGEASAQTDKQNISVTISMKERANLPKSDTIFYDLQQRLTWQDFKGKPVENHFGGAVTASGYAFNADVKGQQGKIFLNLDIFTFFNKLESWKKKDIQTDYHLQHEQLHFDITRLGAERFKNALKKETFTMQNYNRVINDIFDKTYAETIEMQQKYDKETTHSINTAEQLRWNKLIADELKKL